MRPLVLLPGMTDGMLDPEILKSLQPTRGAWDEIRYLPRNQELNGCAVHIAQPFGLAKTAYIGMTTVSIT